MDVAALQIMWFIFLSHMPYSLLIRKKWPAAKLFLKTRADHISYIYKRSGNKISKFTLLLFVKLLLFMKMFTNPQSLMHFSTDQVSED